MGCPFCSDTRPLTENHFFGVTIVLKIVADLFDKISLFSREGLKTGATMIILNEFRRIPKECGLSSSHSDTAKQKNAVWSLQWRD